MSFASAKSWSVFDTASLGMNPAGFNGSVFDGRYLYLVPHDGTLVARFDARQPRALPQLCADAGALHCFSGSFF